MFFNRPGINYGSLNQMLLKNTMKKISGN